jgi:DNA-binding winged helix-turn-helix (wHTH) protein/tetratricopeptide (TPR) repeat protein
LLMGNSSGRDQETRRIIRDFLGWSRDQNRTFVGLFGILGAIMYRLSEFALDLRRQILLQGDRPVGIARKPYTILVYLVENRDRLVTRRELLDRFWDGKDVYDQTLTRAVARIRSALGESREEPRFIETRWAAGYRYIGPFEESSVEHPLLDVASSGANPPVTEEDPPPNNSEPSTNVSPHSSLRIHSGAIYRVALLFLLAIVVSAGTAGILVRHRPANHSPAAPQSPALPIRKSVAILTFRNLAGDRKDNWLGMALAEMLSSDLSSDGRLRTLTSEDLDRASKELQIDRPDGMSVDSLFAMRRNLYADLVVTGSYAILDPGGNSAKQVRVDVKVQDAKTGVLVTSIHETGQLEQLFELTSSAGNRLLATLDLPVTARAGEPNSAFKSIAPEAVREYMKGLENSRAENLEAANDHFEKAIAEDSRFAVAHLALADVWAERGFQRNEKAELKVALSLSENLDREHRLLIEARYSSAGGDWEKAIESYRSLYTFFPDNLDYGLALASTEVAAGKAKDAEATIESLRLLPSPLCDDLRIDLAAAGAAQASSDELKVAYFTQRAMEKAKGSGATLLYARALSMHAGSIAGTDTNASIRESEEARQICTRLNDVACTANILRRLGIYLVESDSGSAEADLKEALRLARRIGNLTEEDNDINALAAILSNRGDFRSADVLYRQMLANERSMNSGWGIQMALNNLGGNLFLEGDLMGSRQMQTEALSICRRIGLRAGEAYASLSLSQIDMAGGDLRQAKDEAEQAISIFHALGATDPHATAMSTLGEIERVTGDLRLAQKDQQAAVEALSTTGDTGDLAQARLALARLYLAEGDADVAAKLSFSSAAEFARLRRSANEACARALYALAMTQNGRPNLAQPELQKALTVMRATQSEWPQNEVRIDEALLAARSPVTTSDAGVQEAIDAMHQMDLRAQSAHSAMTAIEARLAEAELEMRGGHEKDSELLIANVENDARRSGYILLANQAKALLARQQSESFNDRADGRASARAQ